MLNFPLENIKMFCRKLQYNIKDLNPKAQVWKAEI